MKNKTICEVCGKTVERENYSELMLNPKMELIPLCPEHFAEKYTGGWKNGSTEKDANQGINRP